jgi:hypothetical protein
MAAAESYKSNLRFILIVVSVWLAVVITSDQHALFRICESET